MSAVPNFSASQISSEALRWQFLIRSMISDIRTAIPVKVIAVHPGTGSPPSIGTVDVQPLVQIVDGSGRSWNLGVTYGASFGRIQCGRTAIIVDPQVNDIGLAVVCDRDISSAIASAGLSIAQGGSVQPAPPGSARKNNLSDLIYVLSIVSAAPITQYIMGNADGITVLSPNIVSVQGAQINLNGPLAQSNGDVTVQTKLTAGILDAGNGASGTVTTETGFTMIFENGICISITG